MAFYECVDTITLVAGENLNGGVYRCLAINSSGLAVFADAATSVTVGILAEDPDTGESGDDSTGRRVTVALLKGILKVEAGATVAAGALAIPISGGVIDDVATLAATANDTMAIGILLEGGSTGQIVSMLAMPLTATISAA